MRWKIFQRMKFLFRHSSNSRKLSRQKFDNELVCVFTAHLCANKNADWNQQQQTDGGILANRNIANHPYCFLSNQKKSRFWLFCMWSVTEMYHALLPKADYKDKGKGHDRRQVRTAILLILPKFLRCLLYGFPCFLSESRFCRFSYRLLLR